ncbi:phosphoribosylformylglycinamidine cyclo-ligase [Nitrospira sp. T9]|uniref:phosphoribosylformylglycinamidine cyclo-ligase n=1 Tax=unclassified Nitrospira TaxID=2652172 RepID=UPI003F993E39
MATYREAGVDIQQGDDFVKRIGPIVRSTFRPEVMGDIGGFGGLFRFPSDRYREPILVSGTDGVGTKVKMATLMNRHDSIGIDLVAMCVNDIIVSGAEPLFFLDYLATGHLEVEVGEAIIQGIAEGCRQAGCALIGGETAEMPSCYPQGEYDLAGFAVGVVERSEMLGPEKIKHGDVLIGVGSSGLHSNGYSLARKVALELKEWSPETRVPGLLGTVGEALLIPTLIYVQLVKALLSQSRVHGLAHITGGGITGNVPRVIPESCQAVIDRSTWAPLSLFTVLQEAGAIDQDEMFRVFNMGIGLVVVGPSEETSRILNIIQEQGMKGCVIGEVRDRPSSEPKLSYSH